MNYIGNSLRKLRKLNERKQEDIAKCMGISTRQYRKMENDEASVKTKYLEMLSEIYKMPVQDIVHFDKSATSFRGLRENGDVLAYAHAQDDVLSESTTIKDFYDKLLQAKNKLIVSQQEMIDYLRNQLNTFTNKK